MQVVLPCPLSPATMMLTNTSLCVRLTCTPLTAAVSSCIARVHVLLAACTQPGPLHQSVLQCVMPGAVSWPVLKALCSTECSHARLWPGSGGAGLVGSQAPSTAALPLHGGLLVCKVHHAVMRGQRSVQLLLQYVCKQAYKP